MAEVKFMDDNNSWFGGFNALIAGFQRVIMHVWEFVLKRLLAHLLFPLVKGSHDGLSFLCNI